MEANPRLGTALFEKVAEKDRGRNLGESHPLLHRSGCLVLPVAGCTASTYCLLQERIVFNGPARVGDFSFRRFPPRRFWYSALGSKVLEEGQASG